ncbi:class I SAM-dependent methyltransferase [Jannaschia sp. CCS1]|uniref:class I SAM-dependent methyltransferase n=1 Tax=Jannaschia sp. (strain CCS1) TaxID=290400 RepID=UPI000053AFE0|nr:class I SAM-dependent methyltransferase [Jannaschia sp. CCS1]ABD56801.1 16S rRNA m(2)G 1207 methyltransferase [Jannaschia sp. CCS1]
MTPDRWTLAIDGGALELPDGAVLVMYARADSDFASLGDVTCMQGFAPDHERLAARGVTVVVGADGSFAHALVQITKSRAGTLSAIAEALGHIPPGGLLMVDGQKEEGIEAIVKQLRLVFEVDHVFSKSHGKLVWLRRPDVIPPQVVDWIAAPEEGAHGYMTVPGGFSVEGPDRGSEILVALVPELKGRVADFGAGWGYIAGEILAEQEGIETFDLIEADHAMLEAAQHNIDDPRASFHWADVTRFTPEAQYDAIVCNPPFHTGRRADPSLGRAFIQAASRHLTARGRFFMVANRHLPYEDTLKTCFGTGSMLGELEGYKIYEAGKPLAKPVGKPKR